jgi:hypothetical protein
MANIEGISHQEVDMGTTEADIEAGHHHSHHHHHHEAHHHDHEVVLDIATPKGLFKAAFPKTTTIAKVIEVVVAEKHLDAKDKFELVRGDTVLQPIDHTLMSFGLHGTVCLELVATGSGV